MTNQATITELSKAKDAVLRSSLTLLSQGHKAEDIVQILSEVLYDQGYAIAKREGDYQRAAELQIIARYLERLDDHIENYDGAPSE